MHPLALEIRRFIQDESAGSFDELALALFARQFRDNAPYRRLCVSCGTTPATVTGWRDIPTVPATAFKRFDLTCAPAVYCPAVFHSSGTTQGEKPSRHYLDADALCLYEASLSRGFGNAVRSGKEIWALMPAPQDAPHSSLSHMLGALGASRWFAGDPRELYSALKERLAQDDSPITLFGTAFAFVSYFDEISEAIVLPAGSSIVETGGYKGRTRSLSREELYELLGARFGVPAQNTFGEYGMCEMASQFYSQAAEGGFTGPHWVRTRIIDPVTAKDAPLGEAGLLCHYDLANFNSVLTIQTQDRAHWEKDNVFALMGRAPDAELRGCSLTVEELWRDKK